MIKELAAEANGNFSQENGEVDTVEGLACQRMEGDKEFVDRITGLIIGQPLIRTPNQWGNTHRCLQLHQ